MFRFIRRAFPRVWVIITIIIAFIFLASLAFAALFFAVFLPGCGEGYEIQYADCEYD